MSSPRGTTMVHIMGKEYRIVCPPEEEEALLRAARLVDGRMQAIRNTGKVIGTDRIAVMAAINLAHDLLNQPPAEAADLGDTQKRLRNLREQVENALDNSTQIEI